MNNYDPFFNSDQSRLDAAETKMADIKGFPFPFDRDSPHGFMLRVVNHAAVKADLIQLIMTEPGERVMMPSFGTGIRRYIFEFKDNQSYRELEGLIANAIGRWEPRIVVQSIRVSAGDDDKRLIGLGSDIASSSIIISIAYALKENLEHIEALDFRVNISNNT